MHHLLAITPNAIEILYHMTEIAEKKFSLQGKNKFIIKAATKKLL